MATTIITKNVYVGPLQGTAVTFSEINTLTNSAPESTTNVNVSGAQVGMIPVVTFVNTLDTGVVVKQQPRVTAAGQISIYLFNELTTKITPTANEILVRLL
jgi:hypothetical protein